MPYFAAVFARTPQGWEGAELDLEEVETLDELADTLRDSAVEDEPVLLLVEEEDEWFGLARIDGNDDPRTFLSDVRAAATSEPAAMLYDEADSGEPLEEDDDSAPPIIAEPAGDADLLVDLGTSADELMELATEEGLLPADALWSLAERAGFSDELDRLR